MIDRLLDSGKMHVIVAPQPVEYPLSLLRAMKISELKRCMADAGVFFDPRYVVEKEDMVQLFIASGRLSCCGRRRRRRTTVQETIGGETSNSVETTSRQVHKQAMVGVTHGKHEYHYPREALQL